MGLGPKINGGKYYSETVLPVVKEDTCEVAVDFDAGTTQHFKNPLVVSGKVSSGDFRVVVSSPVTSSDLETIKIALDDLYESEMNVP